MDKNASDVIFFFGAGASVPAGVPDTRSFVEEFVQNAHDEDKKKTIQEIVQTLQKWKKQDIDVELLLETLTKLNNQDNEPLLQFYTNKKYILEGYYDKNPLINDLKDFIKNRAIVSENNIKYFQPLIDYIEEFGTIDIISMNYDTCIEQFCNAHKLTYQDGFDVSWNPQTFASKHTHVRLYKLHGSVIWYQTDRGDYIKVPIMTEASRIQLITGGYASNLILYPMQKWDYAEPLLELLMLGKRLLESETCRFVIVVGYSFRDEHIVRVLWDAARQNRKLIILLIDPNAWAIYSEKLKYYDTEHSVPSSLFGRVVCLPYLFDKIFPHLRNYILRKLREGLYCEETLHKSEVMGESVNWNSCLEPFVHAEYTEKIEHLSDRIDIGASTVSWDMSLLKLLKIGMNLSANKRQKEAKEHYDALHERLDMLFVTWFGVEISYNGPLTLRISSTLYYEDGSVGHITMDMFKTTIDKLCELVSIHLRSLYEIPVDTKVISEILMGLKKYIDELKYDRMRGIEIDKYLALRRRVIPDISQFCADVNRLNPSSPRAEFLQLGEKIYSVEEEIIRRILVGRKV